MSLYPPNNRPLTQFSRRKTQSCLLNFPSIVKCTRRSDCEKWMTKNCTQGDRAITEPYCDIGGFCQFPTDGRQPPFARY